MKASFTSYKIPFKNPILTSRGGMNHKYGYFITIENGGIKGIGECSIIKGLSRDNLDTLPDILGYVCDKIEHWELIKKDIFKTHPAIVFAVESALLDLKNGGRKILFESAFTNQLQPIPINGLVWMADEKKMSHEINEKYEKGFRCIKLKVGAIDFEAECRLLSKIRSEFDKDKIEIRVDANGAFAPNIVRERLLRLAEFDIHSIEQPISTNQWKLMAALCNEKIIAIALDEELIAVMEEDKMEELLDTINPQYIILKPSLIGGLTIADKWIAFAQKRNIDWWATSALETNIGLNAISQWVAHKDVSTTQGLGTGELYQKNIASPLYIDRGQLFYNAVKKWGTIDDVCN
jgi:O-succinylbenzoate synthase